MTLTDNWTNRVDVHIRIDAHHTENSFLSHSDQSETSQLRYTQLTFLLNQTLQKHNTATFF